MMGNAQVMTAKVSWDNACYWGITALLFFQRRYRQPEFIASIEPLMRRFLVLHARMQSLFNAWDRADATPYANAAANVMDVGFLRRLQNSLDGPLMEDGDLRARLETNFALLEAFARTWQTIAAERHAGAQPVRLAVDRGRQRRGARHRPSPPAQPGARSRRSTVATSTPHADENRCAGSRV